MSNLVEHARKELALLGEEEATINGYLNVIQAFADMGHSGGSASIAIPTINDLLMYRNLTPLTNDPDEWMLVSQEGSNGIWQSRRNPEAFSNNGGRTYHLLSERPKGTGEAPEHASKVMPDKEL